MKVASGIASGLHPTPDLAEKAVRNALAEAGLERADSVILFLSREFVRHAQPAVLAAARAAGTLQVFGCTTSGLLTERGWLLDQPGAAALVLEKGKIAPTDCTEPILSFSGHNTLPYDWQNGKPRSGLLDSDATAWAHGRLSSDGCAETALPGLQSRLILSTGLHQLSDALNIDSVRSYDLLQIGGQPALDCLRQYLPEERRAIPALHNLCVLRQSSKTGTAILSANPDGSLTLAEAIEAGEQISFAARQPAAAEAEMRQLLAAHQQDKPDFALMFSCIGRGPLFYGNDDLDLIAFRERFPDTPLLGAYGTGQIIPDGEKNRLLQNSVITLLFQGQHV